MATVISKVDTGKQASFLRELENFATANRFAIRISQTTLAGQDHLAQLWREDFKILVVNPFQQTNYVHMFIPTIRSRHRRMRQDETAQKLIDATQGVASCAIRPEAK